MSSRSSHSTSTMAVETVRYRRHSSFEDPVLYSHSQEFFACISVFCIANSDDSWWWAMPIRGMRTQLYVVSSDGPDTKAQEQNRTTIAFVDAMFPGTITVSRFSLCPSPLRSPSSRSAQRLLPTQSSSPRPLGS